MTEHEKKVKKIEENRKEKARQQKEADKKRKEFDSMMFNKLKEKYSGLPKEEINKLYSIFVETLKSNSMFNQIFESKGFKNEIVQAQRRKFLLERFFTEEERSFEAYLKKICKQ